jgi:tRNA modification GTPase
MARTTESNRLVVMNKADLPAFQSTPRCVPLVEAINVSARTGEGLSALHSAIVARLNSAGAEDGSLLITNARHYDLLCNARRELDVALECFRDRHSEELVLAPLHNALKLLGQITGETTTEDILSEIFSTFCIGK